VLIIGDVLPRAGSATSSDGGMSTC